MQTSYIKESSPLFITNGSCNWISSAEYNKKMLVCLRSAPTKLQEWFFVQKSSAAFTLALYATGCSKTTNGSVDFWFLCISSTMPLIYLKYKLPKTLRFRRRLIVKDKQLNFFLKAS